MVSNKLTIVIVDSRPQAEEDEVPPISEIHVETVGDVYMLLQLKTEDGVDIKQDQKQMEAYPYQDDMKDFMVNEKMKNNLIMVIYGNEGERDEDKYLLYYKRWYLYMRDKRSLIKGLYCV